MDDSTTSSIPLKRCSRCLEWKPATTTFFHIFKHSKDGLQRICKVCRISASPETLEARRDFEELHAQGLKRCTKCLEVRAATSEFFHQQKGGKYGLCAECRICQRSPASLEFEKLSLQGLKRCCKCDVVKPLVEYHKHISRHGKSTHKATCKECRKSEPKLYQYTPHPERQRVCIECRRSLPHTDEYFYRYAYSPDGLNRYCIDCCYARKGRTIRRPSPTKGLPEGIRRCTKCGTVHASTKEHFAVSRKRPDGLMPICKKCNALKVREWARLNPDKVLLQQQKPRRGSAAKRRLSWHRYRTRKLSLPWDFTVEDWERCLEYFNYQCVVCGRRRVLARDHWIALFDPRPNNPGTVVTNIVCLCKFCNSSKSKRDAAEWLNRKLAPFLAAEILRRVNAYFDWAKR